jgi:hypothetical protein
LIDDLVIQGQGAFRRRGPGVAKSSRTSRCGSPSGYLLRFFKHRPQAGSHGSDVRWGDENADPVDNLRQSARIRSDDWRSAGHSLERR